MDNGNQRLYAASQNAIFSYDYVSGSLETLNTLNGFSGEFISTINYSQNYNLLIVGYETGLIEVYDPTEGTVLKVIDILNKVTIPPENRRINHFYEYENQLYISTNYGISIYDLAELEFGETFYIGDNGAQLEVTQVYIMEEVIYAATEFGLRASSLNNSNLIDYAVWTTLDPSNFRAIISFQDQLFAVKDDNLLCTVDDLNITPVLTSSQQILNLDAGFDSLLLITTESVKSYSPNLSLINTYSLPLNLNADITSAQIFNNMIFIGTSNSGLLKSPVGLMTSYEFICPEGPLRNDPFSLHFAYGDLWVTFGDYDEDYNPNPTRRYGISYMEDQNWTNISYDSIYQAAQKPIYNLNSIAVNPVNSNQAFISSFQHGLLNFRKDGTMEIFDETNSALQSLVLTGSDYKSIRVSGLKFDSQGMLWSLTSLVQDPLKKFNISTNNWETFSFASIIEDPILDENGFGPLVIGPDGTKWIGSYRNGVIAFNENGNQIRQIVGEETSNLPINHIKSLAMDQNNILWIGTYKGLRVLYNTSAFFNDDNVSTFPIIIIEDGLPKELLELQFITDIIVDGSNNKWISTADAGVFYLSSDGKNTIYHFTKENSPLPSNNINALARDETSGKIFFGTARGLVAFKAGGSTPASSLTEAYIYPNPVRPGFNFELEKIKIKDLTQNVNIKITDVEGNLVNEAQSNTNLRFNGYGLEIDGGTAYWNGKNLANRTVSSGVYLVLISDLETLETRTLKIMFIRQ